MSESLKKEDNQDIYIGARPLKDQIDMIMPTYGLLIAQIDQIRSATQQFVSQKNSSNVRKESNNTIGVFGSRGTGKTSAIYTIQQYLTEGEREKENILLPIIEPDNFGDNTKIMGSIVGLLKEAVKKLLREFPKHNASEIEELSRFYNNCVLKDNNILQNKMEELIEYHLYTESEYRSLLNQNYDDLATHIKKSSRLLIPDIKFKEKMIDLIDEIVITQKRLFKIEQEVLLFIFIDDIDLKTTKCRELVDSILQYANHPNVVTILSGDYVILTESLTMALLHDENLNAIRLSPHTKLRKKESEDDNSEDMTILQLKGDLSHEYLKKIIPPARRHQLVNWNIETIPRFAFGKKTLASQLQTLMKDNQIFGYKESANENLLPIKNSFVIFDKKPRGLVNVYYHIHQINQVLLSTEYQQSNTEEQEKTKYMHVKALIDTIILSSNRLVANQQSFLDKLLRWGSSNESSFIDYNTQNLQLELLIIGEMLKTLLPKIRFDEIAFFNMKESLFQYLALAESDKTKNTNDENEIIKNANRWRYPLYHIVRGILVHTKPRIALLLLEVLSHSREDSYYYEYYDSADRYVKDRDIFMSIYKISVEDNTFLIDLYDESHNMKNDKVNDSINFLNEICTVSSDYSLTEKMFKDLLGKLHGKSEKKAYSKDAFIKRLLFINTLVYLRNTSEKSDIADTSGKYLTGSMTVVAKDRFSKAYKMMLKINENKSENKVLSPALIRVLDNATNKLGEILYNRMSDPFEEITINLTKEIKEAYLAFTEGRNGSEKTIYSGVIRQLSWLENIDSDPLVNFEKFHFMFKVVDKLSKNNQVWFGQSEAIRFLTIIKRTVRIETETFFEGNEKYLLQEMAKYFIASNPAIVEDIEFEQAKKEMHIKLTDAYKLIRGNAEESLEEFELTLEDDESDAEEN